MQLGDVAIAEGDLPSAKERFAEILRVAGRLSDASPSSEMAQILLGLGLDRLGKVARAAGDLPTATARFKEVLRIARKLAKDERILETLRKLGDVAREAGDLPGWPCTHPAPTASHGDNWPRDGWLLDWPWDSRPRDEWLLD